MKILVVAATALEIAPLRAAELKVDVLITGAGIASAVYNLTKKLLAEKYDFAIQAGIAGEFADHTPAVKTFAIGSDCFADTGAAEKGGFRNLFEMNLADADAFPFRAAKLSNPFATGYGFDVRDAITVSTISPDEAVNAAFRDKYSAQIESMEGAAFHFVCLQEKINFLQLRTVSNRVGERDKSKWRLAEAVEDLNLNLQTLIKKLHEQTNH